MGNPGSDELAGKNKSACYIQTHMSLKRTLSYVTEAVHWRKQGGYGCTVGELLSGFPRWQRCLRKGASPLEDGSPWLTFAAIRWLETILNRETEVFEYGCGGSTIFFHNRVRKVVAIEHDETWANRVREKLEAAGSHNVQLLHIPPEREPDACRRDPTDPENYGSTDANFQGCTFRRYAGAIDAFAHGTFHVTVIDGRARPSCFKHALPKVAVGSWLVLDNAERAEYWAIHQALSGDCWQRKDFYGPGPYNPCFWQTTAWLRLR